MKRDDRVFMTGVLVGLVVHALLSLWSPPWWTALITFPVAIWVVVQVVRGWRTELRQRQDQHWKDQS